MIRTVLAACVALPAAAMASAQGAPPPIVGAYLSTDGNIGRGLLVRGSQGCVVLTANHVVASRQDVEVTTSAGKAWTARRGDHSDAGDAALAVPLVPTEIDNQRCTDLPRPEAITAAVQGQGNAALMVTGQGGAMMAVPVVIEKSDSKDIRFKASDPAFQMQQTMSGSPLVIGGIPVAIFQKVDASLRGAPAVALRIDQIVVLIGSPNLAYGAAAPPAASLTDANQMLSLIRQSRPSADMGQVAALQSLSAAGKEVSGLDLAAIGFGGAQLRGLIAKEADFTLADFANATLDGANWSGANLTFAQIGKASFARGTLAKSFGSFFGARAARFDGADLKAVGWRGADLSGASFAGADLQGASLTFGDLRQADFRKARFQDLVLIGSDLRGARFDQASARSIDVTGAVFDDSTFPAGLKPALCATHTTDNVELIFWEALTVSPKTRDQIVDLSDEAGGAIKLRHRADRFFPACPSRAGLLGRDYDAMIDAAGAASDTETVHARLKVEIPTALFKNEARRDAAVGAVKAVTTAARVRDSALDTSNRYYSDRSGTLAAELERTLAAARVPSPMWLNDMTLVLLASKNGIAHPSATEIIASRFLAERYKPMIPAVRRTRDNWGMLFPASMTSTDFTPPIQAIVERWARTASAGLPQDVRISLAGEREESARFETVARVSTLEDILSPYESALHDGNFQRAKSRQGDCFNATHRAYDPADYPLAQKRMNYYGTNETECQNQGQVHVDAAALLGGSWYRGRKFLDLTAGGDNSWTIAFSGEPPASMIDQNGAFKAGVISGRIVRVVRLGPSGKVSIYADQADGKKERRIIVLDSARFAPD